MEEARWGEGYGEVDSINVFPRKVEAVAAIFGALQWIEREQGGLRGEEEIPLPVLDSCRHDKTPPWEPCRAFYASNTATDRIR